MAEKKGEAGQKGKTDRLEKKGGIVLGKDMKRGYSVAKTWVKKEKRKTPSQTTFVREGSIWLVKEDGRIVNRIKVL